MSQPVGDWVEESMILSCSGFKEIGNEVLVSKSLGRPKKSTQYTEEFTEWKCSYRFWNHS